MRQFILANSLLTTGKVAAAATTFGVGFAYKDDTNALNFTADATKLNKESFIVLKRPLEANGNQGDVIIPLYAKNFSYSVAKYEAPVKFSAKVDFSNVEPFPTEEYTFMVVKKGKKFNERNRWTTSVRATPHTTVEDIATRIFNWIKSNDGLGLDAALTGKVLTVTAVHAREDYEIICTQALTPAVVTKLAYKFGQNTAADVADMAEKCAADAGFEYTYREPDLYPGLTGAHGVNVSAYSNGATVITMRFAEPRKVKARDEVVHQIVQIALPASVTIDAIKTTLDALSK